MSGRLISQVTKFAAWAVFRPRMLSEPHQHCEPLPTDSNSGLVLRAPIKTSLQHSPDSLVDDDADGVLRHVEDASGLAVVGLEGHALLEGSVALHCDDVAALVDAIEGRQRLHAVLPERAREHVARSATDTLRIHHDLPVREYIRPVVKYMRKVMSVLHVNNLERKQ